MDQSYQEPSSRLLTRSFNRERLARIHSDPFDVPNKPRSRISESPRRFFNYVKNTVTEAVSGLQKLLNSPRTSQVKVVTPVSSYQQPPLPLEKLSDISSMIQKTISKPEYQKQYGVDSNRDSSQKKASFLSVMNFYNDVSGEKIREKMLESKSLVVPPLVASRNNSVALASPAKSRKESIKPSTRYLDKSDDYSMRDSLNSHGKRMLPSILSKKEKKLEKKVRFVNELRRSNSMIKYISSDDEEDVEQMQKKVFHEDQQANVIKDPPLKISLIKKIKVNPFQKNRVEKTSISQYRMEKGKGYDKFFGGKLNHENSFGSDNLLNDSKIETDSDESSTLHNNYESNNFNNYNKHHNSKEEELSEVSPKDIASPERLKSPSLQHIEEQEMEKEQSNFGEEEEEKQAPVHEEKTVEVPAPVEPAPVAAKSIFSQGLFGQKEIKPMNTESVTAPVAINKPATETVEPTKSLFSQGNSLFASKEAAPVANAAAPKETIAPAKISPMASFLQSVVEKKDEIVSDKAALEQPAASQDSITPPAPIARSTSSLFNDESVKNSIFASYINAPKNDSAMSDNPFLSKPPQRSTSFMDMISGNSGANQQPEATEQKPQATESVFTSNNNNTDATNVPAPVSQPAATGILGILQRSQSSSEGNGIFSNTLKPVGSFSWMGGSTTTQETQQPNLFGGAFNNNSQQQQGQGNMFGGLFSNNNNNTNNNTSGFGGMAFENGNSNGNGNGMMGESNNNNTGSLSGSLFGGNNAFGNNSNGLFQNNNNTGSLSGSLFGGSSFGQNNNNDSNPFTSGMNNNNQANNNPFLSQGAPSGTPDLFRQGSSVNSGFAMGSGKKGKQRERAF